MAATKEGVEPNAAAWKGQGTVAPAWHTAVMILLVLAPLLQSVLSRGKTAAASHTSPAAVPFYVSGLVVLWIWFGFTWLGLRLRAVPLKSIIGGRWTTWKDAAADVGFSFAFWCFWYLVLSVAKLALAAIGVGNAPGSGMIYPAGVLQVSLWVICAASAGIVEEIIFRGYLMRQFKAWSGSAGVALAAQALLFGISHGFYLGLRQVTLVTISGALIGGFALWRKSLRPAIVFHSWADIFGAVIVRGLPFQ